MKSLRFLVLCLLLGWNGATALAAPPTVFLEELTSPELAAAVRDGHTTILLPVGGTEQNGPHMVLGKHTVRVRVLSGRIAQAAGGALVAPVLAYVPEGNIAPPTEHMRFAGTISVPEAAFKAMLDAAARGFRQHGFRDIVLLGDSGNYQAALQAVVARLNQDWAGSGVRAHYLGEYYRSTQTTYIASLKAQGLTDAQIGTHAGTADTALSMAVAPDLVRPGLLAEAARAGRAGGTYGDPRPASAALGQPGVDAVVRQSVAAIQRAVSAAR
jgi:creatinine amidohydrolase/Fe(II)-dependent formamide hydrolase-like protein